VGGSLCTEDLKRAIFAVKRRETERESCCEERRLTDMK
jgi:hypothetical protein